MKFLTYRRREEPSRPGVLEDTMIRTISTPTLGDYIALAPHERIAWHSADPLIPLADVVLEAPVLPPRNVFCVGRNYLEHALEGARASGRELQLPEVPTFFTKASTSIAAPDEELHLPAGVSSEYDFEAELAVVMGARCKDVPEEEAPNVIFGYTALNDITARDLQRAHRQWFKGKSLDQSCPLGPWIVTPEEIGNAQALNVSCYVNSQRKQHSNTSAMIFAIPRLIAELSKGMTLLPGDVIATGTPEGVGFARTPPEFLADGDVLDVHVERIGHLINTIRIG
ncbi:MAG: fumarylacetoacetate hydrolase family protein [Candidatus Eremiobacteraeota bacterium]|nr:fumarylacetoacetate hydrolase family protein [Candidatus Eremiobacteraeota bacterium]